MGKKRRGKRKEVKSDDHTEISNTIEEPVLNGDISPAIEKPIEAVEVEQHFSSDNYRDSESSDSGLSTPPLDGLPKLGRRRSSFRTIAKKIKEDRAAANRAAAAAHRGSDKDDIDSPLFSPLSSPDTEKVGGFNAASMHDVASKVVHTQRAARGFKQMFITDTPEADYVINGIHLEKKKLDMNLVAAEYKEVKRSQFYQELLVYIIFLVVFYMLLGWLPIYDSFEQSDVVRDLICTDSKACDIATISDIYDFADHAKTRICNATEENADRNRWIRIGGVRLRQVRVSPLQCDITSTWSLPCYPSYSKEHEQQGPIEGKDHRVYIWRDGFEGLTKWLHLGVFDFLPLSRSENDIESYGTGGYVLDLCEIQDISTLIEDEWISMGTRAVSLEFTLVNPTTQIYTIGIHVFTLSSSGHLKHYPQGSNVRIVSTDIPGSVMELQSLTDFTDKYIIDIRIALWVVCIGFFFTYVRAEYNEMTKMGFMPYLTMDTWNLFELVQLFVLGSVFYHILVYYLQSIETLQVLTKMHHEKLDHVNMQPLLVTFQRLTDYASVASAIGLLKVFKFLRMNSTLNLLWQVLGMAIKDLMGFLVIFNIIFLSYSYMGSLAFGFALEEFSTLQSSYATCFQMLAGDFDYEQLHQANPRVAPLFFGSFVVLVFQILVNMFVAILSEYYEVAKVRSSNNEDVEYDVITRFKSYLEACAPYVVLPGNDTLELTKGQSIRLISTNLVDKEVTRQRAKKLFRGAVWRVVALLRFGVKFDRRLKFGPRSGKKDEAKNASYGSKSLHIPLSGNFDHRTIKVMLPEKIVVRLEGDSLLGSDILLRVVRHGTLSIECQVLGSTAKEENPDEEDDVLELLGGESLRIPWHFFALHVLRTIGHEVKIGIMRATKFWDPLSTQLVDDYHLSRLLTDAREDGRGSLRFDELYRILDLYLRKDRGSPVTPVAVRRETAAIMYRFRNSLIDMPSREKEGHDYRPNPMDTSKIELGSLEYLSDMLAENCHDIWALERVKQGWTYGPSRDCDLRTHPNLVSYHKLPPEEQAFDYRTSMETLKTILNLNFQIVRNTNAPNYLRNTQRTSSSGVGDGSRRSGSRNFTLRRYSSHDDILSPHFVELPDGEMYYPRPTDTSKVELPTRLTQLVDLLAENAHEVWSQGRMDDGWTYGPNRDDKSKTHPCLVPFIFLTDEEKEYDVNTAMGTLKMLLAMGFNVVDKEATTWGQ